MENNGIKYGIIFGLMQIVSMMVFYFISADIILSIWTGLTFICIFNIGGMVKAVLEERKDKGGFITFKEGFTTAFIFVVVISLMSSFFNYVLFVFIDPGLTDLQMEKSIEMMANWVSGDQLDEAIDRLKRDDFVPTLSKTLLSAAVFTVFLSFVGILVAAAIKKAKPSHLDAALGADSLKN